MLSVLQDWLWKDSYPLSRERLEVWEGNRGVARDLKSAVSDELRRITEQFERTLQAAEHRRQLEARSSSAGMPGIVGSSEAETRQFVKSLLPSLDALDRIIDFGDKRGDADEVFQNWLKSIKGLRLRLTKTLEGIGLAVISSVGMPVDLELHDVIGTVESREYPSNTVVEEHQRGYYFRGKLLRDTKVMIAK